MNGTGDRNGPVGVAGGGLVALLLIVVVGAALRFSFLDARPLWSDELATLRRARADPAELVVDLRRSTHPPLYFWLAGAWADVAGASGTSIRALSALLGTLTIPALYAVGSAWGGPAVGRMAALLLAISPFHVYYSQEARSYTLLALLMTASVWFFLGVLESRRRAGAGWLLSTVAAAYTHYWTIFVVAFQNLHVLGAVLREDGRGLARRWVVLQAALALVVLPWLAMLPAQVGSGSGDWIAPAGPDALAKTLYRFSAGYGVDGFSPEYRYAALAPFLLIHLPLLLLGSLPRPDEDARRRRWRLVLVLGLWTPLVLAFAASILVVPLYVIGRYEMIVFPLFVLLAGDGLSRLPARPRALAVLALGAFTLAYVLLLWFRTGG